MSTARLYFEAVVAIMIMLTLSVISDNRIALMVTIAVVFLAMGAIISLRVWLPSAEASKFGSDQHAAGTRQHRTVLNDNAG